MTTIASLQSLTGKWKGQYTLGPEYETEEGKSVDFILDIKDNKGTITGICIDSETKDYFSEPITVTGFYNSEIISFVKQYPFSYYVDEDGKVIIDRTKKHPEISYTGQYNNQLRHFYGDFELVDYFVEVTDGWLEWKLTGTWTMERLYE